MQLWQCDPYMPFLVEQKVIKRLKLGNLPIATAEPIHFSEKCHFPSVPRAGKHMVFS